MYVPDLICLIYLHTQAPRESVDWTVVDTTVVGVIDHSTSRSAFGRKCEAHLDVSSGRSTATHEFTTFFRILNEHNLLDRLVDNELVSNKVVLNLRH
jgi:hypothetical protein